MFLKNDKRQEVENEYLAMMINDEKYIDICQIKPEWLSQPESRKMLKYILECYQSYETVDIGEIYTKHKDFNVDYYMQLLDDTLVYKSSGEKHFEKFENDIIKWYKEDLIKSYNKKIEKGMVGYDDFITEMKRLDDINIVNTSNKLTYQELIDGINDEKMIIPLNNYPKLSKVLKLVQNDFFIIGATTGAGKSGFLLNLMNDLMFRYQCIYFNMEMSKNTIYKRIVSIKNNIPMEQVTNPLTDNQRKGILFSMQQIENYGVIVEHKANDIREIKAIVSKVKEKDRHTILFIDHLGLCRCDNSKSLYEQATEVAKQLRQLCLEYDCTIIGASQLNRSAYGSDELSLSMLKDSGELENSASKVALLYRSNKNDDEPVNDTKMEIEIAKNRDGLCGNIRLKYDKTKQVFKEEY